MNDQTTISDLVIIGGGVVGCAEYFRASISPHINSVVLLEKYAAVAQVNSNVLANAETLHRGIETNFSLEGALKMKRWSADLIAYLKERGKGIYVHLPSMIIGVTPEEKKALEDRYHMLKPHFPELELIGWEKIADIEPEVMKGRSLPERANMTALYHEEGTAVDYQQLAQSFMREAAREADARKKNFRAHFRTKILAVIRHHDDMFRIVTDRDVFYARTVLVCAGPYSLRFAQQLGHEEAKRFAILPVAGSFYCTPRKVLNGKVYTYQFPHIPFAAPHGDRAVYNEYETRFGPTATILPFFERRHIASAVDFIRMGLLSPSKYMTAMMKILADSNFRAFEFRNFCYSLPIIGKYFFLKWAAQKIVPTLRYRDLIFGKGMGGIRPQLVDLEKQKVVMGLGKFVDDHIIFNVTPSPGASSCMGNAIEDIEMVEKWLSDYPNS